MSEAKDKTIALNVRLKSGESSPHLRRDGRGRAGAVASSDSASVGGCVKPDGQDGSHMPWATRRPE
ncbi:MAG: hypothetical protein KGS09_13790 [Nitrospirae bacterium]|nr:hypothetical protein [Nitrospirota bacterium]